MVQNNVTFLIIITCLIGNIYIDVFLNAIHITIFNVYSTSVTGYTLASSFILHLLKLFISFLFILCNFFILFSSKITPIIHCSLINYSKLYLW